MKTTKVCLAVLFVVLLLPLLGVLQEIQAEREAAFERQIKREQLAALRRYDHDIRAFKQLGKLFQP
jgi:hypothetical protein